MYFFKVRGGDHVMCITWRRVFEKNVFLMGCLLHCNTTYHLLAGVWTGDLSVCLQSKPNHCTTGNLFYSRNNTYHQQYRGQHQPSCHWQNLWFPQTGRCPSWRRCPVMIGRWQVPPVGPRMGLELHPTGVSLLGYQMNRCSYHRHYLKDEKDITNRVFDNLLSRDYRSCLVRWIS